MFDHADTVTGGTGADTLSGWLEPGETALITDFDPSEDHASITVRALDPDHPTGGITIEERDGDSFVLLNGAEILHLRDVTGIPVAINLRVAEMDEIRYVDPSGEPVDHDPTDPQARPLVIGQHITLS
ncbi:MAG: hypothetical protein ACK4GT_17275 [Pararhodobacter sp.]